MKSYLLILLLLFNSLIWSQEYKFGKVSKAELEEAFYPLDSSAKAAILYTERKTHFDYTYDKGFYIVEEYFTRIKIYNKMGYDNATKEVLTYHNSNGKEEIRGIKATTYNLEGNKIVKTKLSNSNIFTEEKSKYHDSNVFTMPNLKPGCVVEWKYTFQSPFVTMLDEVELQTLIPIKVIKVKIATPEYFVYNTKPKGYLSLPIENDRRRRKITYSYRDKVNRAGGYESVNGTSELNFDEYLTIIEKQNIPALKDEAFSGNINNYLAGIKFELSYAEFPNSGMKNYSSSWESIVEKIYLNSSFGEQLKKNNHFEDDLQNILQNVNSIDEKISSIFQFVKKKIKWNGYNSYYSDEGVRKAYKNGVGNVADINLNLVAMLQSAGLDADPVLVSTVKNGIPIFPTRHGFNYVIARVVSPKGILLLDATDINSTPNVLPDRALNFRGRVVRNNGKSEWIELFPKEHSIYKTTISAKFNEEGFAGIARKSISKNYLLDYRSSARDKSKESLIEWIDENYEQIEVTNARVSGLDDLEKDVTETIQFETESFYEEIAGKTYISPLLYLQKVENVFKSEKREFPIFYNTPWGDVSTVSISIPEAYSLENVPENVEYVLPNDLGVFSYSISPKEKNIEIKSALIINQAVISANYYQDLKEFYNKIIIKQNEKIVLSK